MGACLHLLSRPGSLAGHLLPTPALLRPHLGQRPGQRKPWVSQQWPAGLSSRSVTDPQVFSCMGKGRRLQECTNGVFPLLMTLHLHQGRINLQTQDSSQGCGGPAMWGRGGGKHTQHLVDSQAFLQVCRATLVHHHPTTLCIHHANARLPTSPSHPAQHMV